MGRYSFSIKDMALLIDLVCNFQKALATAKHMLELWKHLYEGQTISDVPECDRKSDTRSVFQLYTTEMSDKDSSMSFVVCFVIFHRC